MTADGTYPVARGREVRTAAEVSELTRESVLRLVNGLVAVKTGDVWGITGYIGPQPIRDADLPATVLFRPDAPQPATGDAVERHAWALYPDGTHRGSALRTAFREGADAGARAEAQGWTAWAERVAEKIPEDYLDGETERDIIERGVDRLLVELGRHWDEGFAAGQHPANLTATGGAVERAARASWEAAPSAVVRWEHVPEATKAAVRVQIRAALAAARAGEADGPDWSDWHSHGYADGYLAAQRGGEAVDREALVEESLSEYMGLWGTHTTPAQAVSAIRATVNRVLDARGDAAPTVTAAKVREAVEASGQSEPMIRTLLAVLGIEVRD